MNSQTTRTLLVATGLAALYPAAAHAEFCSSYQQTASNSGDCPTCTLSVRKKGARSYVVSGNNGWRANFTRMASQSGGAGEGSWDGSGETFAFSMFETSGGARITMRSATLNVDAQFRCTTP